MFLACMAIRLNLIRLIWASLIACMGNFRGDPLSTEPAYAENRVGTYNVPPGSSANPYGEARRAEFDGTDGRGTKVSFKNLHTLVVYR